MNKIAFMLRLLFIYLFNVWNNPVFSELNFNMYHTGNDQQDAYCILYYSQSDTTQYLEDDTYVLTHQIIPYCLRRGSKDDLINIDINHTLNSRYTFEQLKDQNITSEELFSWSAPIDLAEEYQSYLLNPSQWLSSERTHSFSNCTFPWFGLYCEFAFDPLSNQSLDQILLFNFQYKPSISSGHQVTCYEHLRCQTSLVCLDWREICDRKADCFNGIDELHCWQLEINTCADNEYRYHQGQCIPQEFFRDNSIIPDCLDGTDEIKHGFPHICDSIPTFQCEEQTCQPGPDDFPCGDGNCVNEKQSFCFNGRNNLFVNDNCSRAMACVIYPRTSSSDKNWCAEFCPDITCVKRSCPEFSEFSVSSKILGHIRLMFNITTMQTHSYDIPLPDYLCYNADICADYLPVTVHWNNFTCRRYDELKLEGLERLSSALTIDILTDVIKHQFHPCLIVPEEINHCNYSSMYQCEKSRKCISKSRLADAVQDCPLNDDETFKDSCSLDDTRFRSICTVQEQKMCIAPYLNTDETRGCQREVDETRFVPIPYDTEMYFSKLCDGKTDLKAMKIHGTYETDETNCEQWPCNNTYTRCNGFWSCKDGADEVNCPDSNCPVLHHRCIFRDNPMEMSCLPMNRSNDGIIDCLGATDERIECQAAHQAALFQFLKCWNYSLCIRSQDLCDGTIHCPLADDELFCTYSRSFSYETCQYYQRSSPPSNEDFLCDFMSSGLQRLPTPFFKLSSIPTYPADLILIENQSISSPSPDISIEPSVSNNDANLWRYNRGLSIYIQTKINGEELHCLCPPAYYGETCQYQNERVSLTLQIQATSDWLRRWIFLLILVDEEEIIQSHDYIEYFPPRDCQSKFNVYLIYSTRPKNPLKNYSVRIHVFNQMNLKYRASWIYPIQFPFLPVYRLAVQLAIPWTDSQPLIKCKQSCMHGQCFKNINDPFSTFCLCESGWSGNQCQIQHTQNCALNSLSLGVSICVCSTDQFGPRCYLSQPSCSPEMCTNRGQCVLTDRRYSSKKMNKPMCICSEEYFGDHCQYHQTRIDLSFHHQLSIPSSIIIHFITVKKDEQHIRTTVLKKLAVDQSSLSFYTLITFHVALVEISREYYLIILHEKDIVSANISTEILPSRRCLSLNELFHPELLTEYLLKRIKSYQLPCQQRLDLVCFYDEQFICLCTLDHQTNCFQFNHNVTYDCHGHNYCENAGQCFRDDSQCPKSSNCGCPDCYFGSRCQFSTKGSTLSLDMILGYYIKPNIGLNAQSTTIQISIALTTSIFTLGMISNLLTILAFRMKTSRKTGCALYILSSSIISMLAMIVLTIKFVILVASQIGSIGNHLFVSIQCQCLDYLVRFLLSTNDWLSACVAIERAGNLLQGIHFNRTKSERMARYIIPIVLIVNALTHIHDPIHRHLIADDDEQRAWCIVKYSSFVHLFDWIINLIHFVCPFILNGISALIILVLSTRTRSNVKKKQSYKTLLREQFHLHKHLFISPCILIVLAQSRLIISFLSGCMKSARNPWLYFSGYFISYIPPMMTFVVFILPSKTYTEQLMNSFKDLCLK